MRILNGQQQNGLKQLQMCVCACVYSYIPNNTAPFALNLLSQINFTDI